MKKNLNQKLINLIEYYNLINANFFLSNKITADQFRQTKVFLDPTTQFLMVYSEGWMAYLGENATN